MSEQETTPSNAKRAIRNGGIFSFIIAAVGLYQGESLLTSVMVWGFAWLVTSAALWLSYRMTAPKKPEESNQESN